MNGKSLTTNKKTNSLQCYIMIAPQILGFLIFSLYPILWVIGYSFFDYDGINATFVGFNNFSYAFRDVPYWNAFLNTFIIAIGKLFIELPLALGLAVLLNDKLRGKSFFRLMFFMPNIISVAIVGIIFSYMFSSFNGVINTLIVRLGGQSIDWFANKWTAIIVVMIASIWEGFGVNMIYFLSGLMNIPEDLYEACSLDGANKWQQFIHITLPQLASVSQVICMMAITSGLKMNDIILVLTNGQPGGKTEVVMSYLFKKFFGESTQVTQIGYTCSLGVVTSIVIALITILYLKMSKKAANINN